MLRASHGARHIMTRSANGDTIRTPNKTRSDTKGKTGRQAAYMFKYKKVGFIHYFTPQSAIQ